jgi:hypothetical protein
VAAYYYEAMVRYGESVLVTDLQGRHHQGRCSGSVGAEGEVGGVALVAQRGRDAGVGAAVAGGVAGFVVVGEGRVAGAPTVARSVTVGAMTSLSLSASRARLRKSKLGAALWEGWLGRRTFGQRRERIGGGSVAEQPADSVVGEDLVADRDHKEPAGRAAQAGEVERGHRAEEHSEFEE